MTLPRLRFAMTVPKTLSTLGLALTLSGTALAQGMELDYERLAGRFLESHGLAEASPADVDIYSMLQDNYLHLQVGLFEVYAPAALHDDSLEHFQRVVVALQAAQDRWLEWLEPSSRSVRDLRKDQKAIKKWLESWRKSQLEKAAEAGGGDMLELLDARSSVREAFSRYGDYMLSGASLGLDREGGHVEPVILVPDRGRFVEFVCFGGWFYEHAKEVFWQPGVENWTHFQLDEFKMLATRYASPSRQPGDYQSGVDMDARTSTGLEQQIVQLSTNSLFANYFGERVPPSLAGALAVNLVIDLYGECNTRADGDLRSRRTEAREIFVPGGNPDGGILPPNLADSRWRETHGADRFVSVLKSSMQKRRARDPFTFELKDDREIRRTPVQAPFLGQHADATAIASEFYGDRLEFLRSYRTCFMYWLREEAAGSRSNCEDTFANLLLELAHNTDPERLEAIFGEVYGDPLSAPAAELGKKDLEGRFLSWLAKTR